MSFDVEQMYPCIPQAKPMLRLLWKKQGGEHLLSPVSFNTESRQKLGWVAETFLIKPPNFPHWKRAAKSRQRELLSRIHSSTFPDYYWIQTLCKVPCYPQLGIFALSPRDEARESYLLHCIKVFNWHKMQIRKCIFYIYCNSRKYKTKA